ncbi:MAG: magnesium transporter CorA family protein [Lysobacter sp.]
MIGRRTDSGSYEAITTALPEGCAHIILYDADGADRNVGLEQIDAGRLQEHQLLWIDVECDDADLVNTFGRLLGVPAGAIATLQRMDSTPHVENYGGCFHVQIVAVEHEGALKFNGTVLGIVAGSNYVLSVHHKPVPFIAELRDRERGESELGALSAESFTASLLDWQLSTYFEAVSVFEAAVERLEVEILSEKNGHCLDELRSLRRGASRLRRMLAPHRAVFAGLARPDFRPRSSGDVNAHFLNLDTHYERALDLVQNTRDLVIGSFELFSSQTALRTNETMRTLTFVTVLIGTLAVIAGLLGMNFAAPFFETGAKGFWWALAGMGAIVVLAVLLGRRRRWL